MELEFKGGKIIAVQAWIAPVPELGTLILGETEAEARATLKRFESGEQNSIDDIELQLRLVLSTPNSEQRHKLLKDWLLIWAHDAQK